MGEILKKLQFLEVIKYEGPNNVLVWKHPAEDFNTNSTLIVHESQVAIFMKNGQNADVFEAGRYVLKTENIPVLRRLMNIPTGGESTFHCEVYYINTVERMAIRWGTDSKVQFIEPTYNFPMEIGASGEMSLRIKNPAEFLVRLIGTEQSLTADGLTKYFRGLLMTRVKSHLARTIKEQKLNIFEIDSQLDVLSDAIRSLLAAEFEVYGINLVQFFISTVVRPEDDPGYRRLKDLTQHRYTDIFEAQTKQQVDLIKQQTESQKRIMEAQSIAEKRRLEGYTYQDERGFDVAEIAARNEATGQFTSMGMGLGMMVGVGGALGNTVGNMVGNTMQQMPTGTPYGQPVNLYGQSVNPYGQPMNPYGQPVNPYEQQPVPQSGEIPQPNAVPQTEQMPQSNEVPQPEQTSQPNMTVSQQIMGMQESHMPAVKFCPNCGLKTGIEARFCMRCGTQI